MTDTKQQLKKWGRQLNGWTRDHDKEASIILVIAGIIVIISGLLPEKYSPFKFFMITYVILPLPI
jgi:uncharacterized membrane protein